MSARSTVSAGAVRLGCDLRLPAPAAGVVVFAHGSGSSRRSPRNVQVARTLHEARFATVLFDLLTPLEAERDARDASLRFDVGRLGDRLGGVVGDLATWPELTGLPVGLFGASTGAAAALRCAASRADLVRAVVSRGGRPDLAGDALPAVRAPTLLLVGARDREVRRLNERAAAAMTAEVEVEVVPGASHLFEERGALEDVARRAVAWFNRHLRHGGGSRPSTTFEA